MVNTIISIKKSTVTATPPNGELISGQPGYSYVSNTLFIGTSDAAGVLPIGGHAQVLKLDAAFAAANAAAGGSVVDAYTKANLAYTFAANNAFLVGNSAYALANTTWTYAANTVMLAANTAYGAANTTWTYAANTVMSTANGAYNKANTANSTADAASAVANFANTAAIAALTAANTKFNSSGGTISGDVSVTGNVSVSGDFVAFNSLNYLVNDPLLILANNNVADVVDIGVIGQYKNTSSINVYTGIYRDSGTKEWYLFSDYYDGYLANTNHIDPDANGFVISTLNATIKTSNIWLGGINAISRLDSIWARANDAYTFAANLAMKTANSAYALANSTWTYAANDVMKAANSAYAAANTTWTYAANNAFLVGNSAYAAANTTWTYAANTVMLAANSAYDKANSANINAADAGYLSTGTVPSGRLSGSYTGITGVGTITAGVWNGTNVHVAYGGTGRLTLTQNGILYGNTTGPVNITEAGTEGQVLQANENGVPFFGHLDGGSFLRDTLMKTEQFQPPLQKGKRNQWERLDLAISGGIENFRDIT